MDSGGTFTDVCLFDEEDGRVEVWKVPSTPDDPSRGIAGGVEEGMRRVAPARRAPAASVSYFGHGTTVATNALIQHRGVRTGLITTDGFRDLLEIGRQKRPDLYDLQADKPPVLVPRDLRLEVPERVRPRRRRSRRRSMRAVRAAARRAARAAGVRAVAVCFLYGFVRPEHEQRARAILREEIPEAFVCASHEVAPEFREFERLSTAVVNAYLGPVMQRLHRAARRAAGRARHQRDAASDAVQRRRDRLRHGGAPAGAHRAVGPSTGVVGAQAVGALSGFGDLITFDMGGTSTDVALLQGGRCRLASEAVVHGYPIKAPMLDIHTVGAGGGSIAYVDTGGLLKVGPRSAGADPGPVCYGRGNDEPTVTDANVVLQTLNPDASAGRAHERCGRTWPSGDRAAGRQARARHDGDRAGHHLGRHRQHGARDPRDLACSAATIRATTRWWRSAAPGRCTPRGWPASWRSRASWCRAIPASCARWACC